MGLQSRRQSHLNLMLFRKRTLEAWARPLAVLVRSEAERAYLLPSRWSLVRVSATRLSLIQPGTDAFVRDLKRVAKTTSKYNSPARAARVEDQFVLLMAKGASSGYELPTRQMNLHHCSPPIRGRRAASYFCDLSCNSKLYGSRSANPILCAAVP